MEEDKNKEDIEKSENPNPSQDDTNQLKTESLEETPAPQVKISLSNKKKIIILIITLILIAELAVIAYYYFKPKQSTPSQNNINQSQSSSEQPSKTLSDSQNKLGVALMKELYGQSDESTFISPSSISLAMSMAYNGAAGATQEEMHKVMQFGNLTKEQLNSDNLKLMQQLDTSTEDVQTSVANSVWTDTPDASNNNFTLKDSFKNTLTTSYLSEPFVIDLQTDEAKDQINNWVSEETNEKIPVLVTNKLPEDYVFMLINAIYFKGNWKYTFDESLTQNLDFTDTSNNTAQVPTMSQAGKFQYSKDGETQIIELPYGKDEKYVMNVILPENLDNFMNDLSYENLSKMTSSLSEKEGTIELPKFKFEYSNEKMVETFKALGMNLPFSDENADFSELSDTPTKIDSIIHMTVVEVNETGTEAAAVTAIGGSMTTSVGDAPETFYMQVNKPFFVVIRDKQTNIPLFMGAIKKINS